MRTKELDQNRCTRKRIGFEPHTFVIDRGKVWDLIAHPDRVLSHLLWADIHGKQQEKANNNPGDCRNTTVPSGSKDKGCDTRHRCQEEEDNEQGSIFGYGNLVSQVKPGDGGGTTAGDDDRNNPHPKNGAKDRMGRDVRRRRSISKDKKDNFLGF